MILGLAEIGRAYVVGPIIFSAITCEENKLEKLRELKNISEIKKVVNDWRIIKITPDIIDNENLNKIEIKILSELVNEYAPKKVFINPCIANNLLPAYLERIKNRSLWKTEFIFTDHYIIQMAKILARQSHKKEIKKLIKKYGDFGSGHPKDTKTLQFIENWNKYPEIIRKKWITAKEVLVKKGKLIIIGDKDTGKTELCKLFANIAIDKNYIVGILDLDVGQSHIGKPGNIGFGIVKNKIKNLLNVKPHIIYPIGSLSPVGVEEKIFNGIKHILSKIPQNIDFLVIDTTGYIKGEKAKTFKLQKINLLTPDKIILLEKDNELAHIINCLDKNKIYKLPIDLKVKKKTQTQRKKFRSIRLSYNF